MAVLVARLNVVSALSKPMLSRHLPWSTDSQALASGWHWRRLNTEKSRSSVTQAAIVALTHLRKWIDGDSLR